MSNCLLLIQTLSLQFCKHILQLSRASHVETRIWHPPVSSHKLHTRQGWPANAPCKKQVNSDQNFWTNLLPGHDLSSATQLVPSTIYKTAHTIHTSKQRRKMHFTLSWAHLTPTQDLCSSFHALHILIYIPSCSTAIICLTFSTIWMFCP